MFNRFKKSAANASQKKKHVISLPSDVLAEVFRYFSRKQLCQQIYAVNRRLYNLANSHHQVPTIHIIDQIHFHRSEQRASLHRSLVQIGNNSTISSRQFKAMSPPGLFIRFRNVLIERCLGENTLKFLRQTEESFIGSVVDFPIKYMCEYKKMISQMHHLLQNIFNNPQYVEVTVSGGYLQFLEFVNKGGALPYSNKIKVKLGRRLNCKQTNDPNVDTIRVLLKWLIGDNNLASGSVQGNNSKKHLILDRLLRKLILDLVKQIKEAFESNNSLLSDFVITFVECWEDIDCCLKGDHEFFLDKISTGERLSFFRHLEYGPFSDRAYRLWYRKVTSDAEDATMLSYLKNSVKPDSNFKDLKFYDFSYPFYYC